MGRKACTACGETGYNVKAVGAGLERDYSSPCHVCNGTGSVQVPDPKPRATPQRTGSGGSGGGSTLGPLIGLGAAVLVVGNLIGGGRGGDGQISGGEPPRVANQGQSNLAPGGAGNSSDAGAPRLMGASPGGSAVRNASENFIRMPPVNEQTPNALALKVCNRSSESVDLALGLPFLSYGAGHFASAPTAFYGWFNIPASTCQTFDAPAANIYFYGIKSPSGDTYQGNALGCVDLNAVFHAGQRSNGMDGGGCLPHQTEVGFAEAVAVSDPESRVLDLF